MCQCNEHLERDVLQIIKDSLSIYIRKSQDPYDQSVTVELKLNGETIASDSCYL